MVGARGFRPPAPHTGPPPEMGGRSPPVRWCCCWTATSWLEHQFGKYPSRTASRELLSALARVRLHEPLRLGRDSLPTVLVRCSRIQSARCARANKVRGSPSSVPASRSHRVIERLRIAAGVWLADASCLPRRLKLRSVRHERLLHRAPRSLSESAQRV
jgi:hypothetical protein